MGQNATRLPFREKKERNTSNYHPKCKPKAYKGKLGGVDEFHNDLLRPQILKFENKHRTLKSKYFWTGKDKEVLRNNLDLSLDELCKLFPTKTRGCLQTQRWRIIKGMVK